MILGLIVLTFASFIGGAVSPVLVKLGVGEIPPITFSAIRFILATIIFLPFYLKYKKTKLKGSDIKLLTFASIPFAANIALFSTGIQFTTAIMSQIFYAAGSVIVAFLAYLFLKEKLTAYKIIGLLLALIGMGFLIERSIVATEVLTFGTVLGNGIIILAVLAYSSYLIISQKMTKTYSPTTTNFFSFITTSLILLIIAPVESLIRPMNLETITGISMMAVIGLAIFSSAVYFFLVQFGIRRTSAFTASMFHYTAPFLAGITSIPILGEKPTLSLLFGGLLVLIGVFIATTYQYLKNK